MYQLFQPYMTLQEMEIILERYCLSPCNSYVYVTKMIPLSQDDVALMADRIHHFANLTGDVSAYYSVRLSIIVYWIYAGHYAETDYTDVFYETLHNIPQHHVRFYVDMFAATLCEFDIDTFREDYESLAGISRIMYKQANY